MFGWAFHLLWHTKRRKHRLQQKSCFSFLSLAKVRGSKSQNEQKQRYHILVKMSAAIIEIILGDSFDLFHAPGSGYIIFYNSCPLLDISIVCEKRNYKQLNFLSISITSFLLHSFEL